MTTFLKRSHLILWLIAFLTFVCSSHIVSQEAEAFWHVEQHCVGAPVAPPPNWTFPGTIFKKTSRGVHASRADMPTSYIIAFGNKNFVSAGDISPDGRWFATPYGRNEYGTWVERRFLITEWRVYSTDRTQTMFRIPLAPSIAPFTFDQIFAPGDDLIPQVHWIDNEHFVYQTNTLVKKLFQINPFTEEVTELPLGFIKPQPGWWWWTLTNADAPDGSRGLEIVDDQVTLVDRYSQQIIAAFPPLTHAFVSWRPDSSGFFAKDWMTKTGASETVWIGGNGDVVEFVSKDLNLADLSIVAWTKDGTRFTALATPTDRQNRQLYIGEFKTKTLTDLCVSPDESGNRIIWSPDDAMLVYQQTIHRRLYVMILDLTTNSVYRTDYTAGRLGAWK